MKKKILEYTIRVNKKQTSLIEIAIKDWPTYRQPFTFWSQKEGHTAACSGYYYKCTRPATEEEKKAFESDLKLFTELYSDEYVLKYVKNLTTH
jgi:hypothetical protein